MYRELREPASPDISFERKGRRRRRRRRRRRKPPGIYRCSSLIPPFIINHNRHPSTGTHSPWNLIVDLPTVAIHSIVPIHAINAVSISVVEPRITLHGRFLLHPVPIREHLVRIPQPPFLILHQRIHTTKEHRRRSLLNLWRLRSLAAFPHFLLRLRHGVTLLP